MLENGNATPERLTYEELEQMVKDLKEARAEYEQKKSPLEDGEGGFQYIFETENVGQSIISLNGIGKINGAFAAILGYSCEELQGKAWQEITFPEDIDLTQRNLNSLLSGERNAIRFEKRYLHKDGSVIWADVSIVLHRDHKGNPLNFISTIVDISEKKIAVEALIESEKRYRKAQSLGKVGNWDYNLVTGHFWGSDEAKRIYGFDSDSPDFTTEDVESCIPDRERVHQVLVELIEEGKEYNIEFDIIAKNTGERKTIHSIAEVEKKADGTPLKVSGVVTDITADKRINDELKRRNSFIESVMDNMPIGLALNRIDDGEVLYLNAKFEEIYGWSRDILTNISLLFDKVFPDLEYRNKMKMQIMADIQSGDPERMVWNDLKITSSSGEERFVTATSIPLIEQNLMISTVENTTDRKLAQMEQEKLQDQLLQSRKMESVGRLAGGVSHDFNNILGIIIGYTELALGKTEMSDPLHDYLLKILSAARRSTNITQQLLAYARKQQVVPRVLDLNSSIEDIMDMLQRMIGEDSTLIWLPGSSVWPVKMDSSQILQLLVNLCINARDALGNIGRITIETDNVVFSDDDCREQSGFQPGEFVVLSVSDNGCGMTPETQDKLFEPFYTTKDIGRGTGLGMATVYGIVKQNNGFISVYSEVGKGTIIKIYLPRYKGRIEQKQRERKPEIPQSRNEMVLLVEDDDIILELGKIVLNDLGYVVLSTNSPLEAIRLAAENSGRVKLLITDVIMPDMNGRELSEQLQKLHPELKVLYISGYTADIIANRGLLEEGFNFISKPFSLRDLAEKVRDVLDQVQE